MNYSREAVEKGGPPERRWRTADADQKTTEKLEKTCGGIWTLKREHPRTPGFWLI